MQKYFISAIVLILLASFVTATNINNKEYIDPLTKGYADTLYCSQNGNCNISTLSVGNLTVWGDYLNISVVDYNITGDISVAGNISLQGTDVRDMFMYANGSNSADVVKYKATSNFEYQNSVITVNKGRIKVEDNPNQNVEIYNYAIDFRSPAVPIGYNYWKLKWYEKNLTFDYFGTYDEYFNIRENVNVNGNIKMSGKLVDTATNKGYTLSELNSSIDTTDFLVNYTDANFINLLINNILYMNDTFKSGFQYTPYSPYSTMNLNIDGINTGSDIGSISLRPSGVIPAGKIYVFGDLESENGGSILGFSDMNIASITGLSSLAVSDVRIDSYGVYPNSATTYSSGAFWNPWATTYTKDLWVTTGGHYNDNVELYFGTGASSLGDTYISHSGTYWDFYVRLATSAIRFNQGQINTDFQVYGDNRQTMQLDAQAGTSYIRANTNSVTAFQFQDASNTNIMNIDATNKRVGIYTASPSTKLDVNGNITSRGFINASTNVYYNVTKEIIIPVYTLKLPVLASPTENKIENYPVLSFDKNTNQEVYSALHVTEDYREGTDFGIAFYWSPSDTDTGNVQWCINISYKNAENNELLTGNTKEYCILDAGQGLSDEVLKSPIVNMGGINLLHDQVVGFTIFRNASSSLDTYDNDANLVLSTIYYNSYRMGE